MDITSLSLIGMHHNMDKNQSIDYWIGFADNISDRLDSIEKFDRSDPLYWIIVVYDSFYPYPTDTNRRFSELLDTVFPQVRNVPGGLDSFIALSKRVFSSWREELARVVKMHDRKPSDVERAIVDGDLYLFDLIKKIRDDIRSFKKILEINK